MQIHVSTWPFLSPNAYMYVHAYRKKITDRLLLLYIWGSGGSPKCQQMCNVFFRDSNIMSWARIPGIYACLLDAEPVQGLAMGIRPRVGWTGSG